MQIITGRKQPREYRHYGGRTAIWFCSSHDDDHKVNELLKCTKCPICNVCHEEVKREYLTQSKNHKRGRCRNNTLLNNKIGMKPFYSSEDDGERYECKRCKNIVLFDSTC